MLYAVQMVVESVQGNWRCLLVLASVLGALGCGESAQHGSGGLAGMAGGGAAGKSSTPTGGSGNQSGKSPSGGESGESGESGVPSADVCQCDDGVECTLDVCNDEICEHTARHFSCPAGQRCTAEGCRGGDACATDEDCERPDPCVTTSCDAATARCVFAFLDGDHDGVAPESCGGADCNDADSGIYGGHPEACDGKDNDCDGLTDPPKDSGCPEGKSCAGGACVCNAPTNACGAICVNLKTDNDHCGACATVCADNETCQESECECNAGLNRCNGACIDYQTDPHSCGSWENSCGNGRCEGGGCLCPPDTEDCSANDILDCKAIKTDLQNCGACGERCLSAGQCASGSCDTSLEWVKLYGSYAYQRQHVHVAPMAADASGNTFVAFAGEPGSYQAIPGGDTTLWTSANVVAKFDPNGDLEWVKPSGVWPKDVAVIGSDVWVMAFLIYTSGTVTLAGQEFTVSNGYQAATIVVKLKGSDGSVLEHFQLDHPQWNTSNEPFFIDDGANLFIAGQTTDVVLGETIWTRPSPDHYAYIYEVGGDAHWLPGTLGGAALDANGKILVALSLPASSSVSLGGDTFTTSQYGGGAIARFTQAFVHEASYANGPGGRFVNGMSPITLIDGGGAQLLRQVDDSGAVTKSGGGTQVPFLPYKGQARNGRVFMIGNTSSGGASYEGRTLPPSYSPFLMSFNGTSFALERAVAFDAELDTAYGYGSVEDLAIVDGGTAVILSVLFDGGVHIGDRLIDAGTNYQGLALVKLKLYDP